MAPDHLRAAPLPIPTLLHLHRTLAPAPSSSAACPCVMQSQSLPYTYAQVTRGLFSGGKGSFTSFFTRTGYGGSPAGAPGGEASIHGGAMGGFRQVSGAGMAAGVAGV